MLSQAVLDTRDTVTISVANLNITREPEPRGLVEPAIGYHYRIQNADNPRSRGFVDLTFESASEYGEARKVADYLRRSDIAPDATVADLVNFYPHGLRTEGKEQALFRRGVGGAIFDIVLKDCKAAGAGLLVAVTTTPEVRNFLSKRGFAPISQNSTLYALTLDAIELSAGQLAGATWRSAQEA